MEILFLGTGAAEGFPAAFCSCDACRSCREAGGRSLRLRSSVLIDGVLKIDNGPDSLAQAQRLGLCMDSVRTIVYTHTHPDHVSGEEMFLLAKPFTWTLEHTVNMYGPGGTSEVISGASMYEWVKDDIVFEPVHPFKAFDTPEGYSIVPLLARHVSDKVCLNHLVTGPDGRTLLYATDNSGWPPETWKYLESEKPGIDVAVMEGTYGTKAPKRGGVHLDFNGLYEHRNRMMKMGLLGAGHRFYATHFSHNGCGTHDEMEKLLGAEGVIPAYDGLVVKV
ncbi:MAG: MBL fold metallo-hydrolase [Planctomycetes bacterium]|nr:MBL fold metallo-hydrolase [Planctomycetota bacterium]